MEEQEHVWVCRVRHRAYSKTPNGCLGGGYGSEERAKQLQPNTTTVRPGHVQAGCGWYVLNGPEEPT